MNEVLVSMKNVRVNYNEVPALKGVDFNLFKGEIHGLVGEHRAGKSSLVKLLSGAVQKQEGEIRVRGRLQERITPLSARNLGISIIYQYLNIIPSLSAIENIYSGRPVRNALGFIRKKEMARESRRLLEHLRAPMDLNSPLISHSERDKHMVELAKALSNDPEVIIFDEISSKLTPEEMERVYGIIQDFKAQGKSVIYITHNLDEIFRLADRVTILKGGYRCGTEDIRNLDRIKLIKLTYTFVRSRQELEDENRELHLLRRYNESVMDSLPVGLMILDKRGELFLANRMVRDFLETESPDALSLQAWIGGQEWPEGAEIQRALAEQGSGIWEQLPYQNDRVLTVKCIPFKDDDHRFIGTIVLVEDITQLNRMTDYLVRTEKIASIAELAAGVAHEVNNPLGIVLNHLDLMKRSLPGGDADGAIAKIEKEILRISEITGSLLSFSRMAVSRELCNLAVILKECLILLGHMVKKKAIELRTDLPDRVIPVQGSPNQLKQVILNLILNASEAVLEGGRIRLTLRDEPEQGRCVLEVWDNGCGIPGEHKAQVFNAFFTTKAGKKNTGLGLSICQHIVEAHDGVIACESAPGDTRMSVILPLAERGPA